MRRWGGALPIRCGAPSPAAGPDCVVTDVGSVKGALVAGCDDPRFIGGHPIAGAETSGVEHARADLFEGAVWYLTPLERSSACSTNGFTASSSTSAPGRWRSTRRPTTAS